MNGPSVNEHAGNEPDANGPAGSGRNAAEVKP